MSELQRLRLLLGLIAEIEDHLITLGVKGDYFRLATGILRAGIASLLHQAEIAAMGIAKNDQA